MSKLYVTEYAEVTILSSPGNQPLQIAKEPPIAEQVVDYSGGVTASSAFNAATRFVRLTTDAICSIAFGAAPTATTSTQRMAADTVEYKGVLPAQKVSAIANT